MKKELLDDIAAGFTKLINDELGTDSTTRFRRAGKLCAQAHNLLQMNAMRVGDIDGEQEEDEDFGMGMRMGVARGRIIRPTGSDSGDTIREVVHAMGPMIAAQANKGNEGRLSQLLSIRKRLEEASRPTDAIDTRIDALLETLNKETAHGDTGLDDSIVLRRPALGSDRPEDDSPDHGEGDGEGEGSAGQAADRCA